MRFDPTGFPGCVSMEEDEEPPQAASARAKAKMAHRAHPWELNKNKTGLVVRRGGSFWDCSHHLRNWMRPHLHLLVRATIPVCFLLARTNQNRHCTALNTL